ncbi:hypothetical protein GmHk_14G042135 [Glycine max]|nr:hypothetical protein GmHk_14G042135 [Glycine max]
MALPRPSLYQSGKFTWREAGIVTGSGDIGGERKNSVVSPMGMATPKLGLVDRDGKIGQGQSRR